MTCMSLQTKELVEVIDECNCHRCDSDPIEAGIYCLEAKGGLIEKFRSNAKAILTVEVAKQQEKTTKKSAVNVRVDVPRQEPDKVHVVRTTSLYFFYLLLK